MDTLKKEYEIETAFCFQGIKDHNKILEKIMFGFYKNFKKAIIDNFTEIENINSLSKGETNLESNMDVILNILLVNPETPATFQNFRNALDFISKKSDGPPLGLLTVAAILPETWRKKLIDTNVTSLKDKHLHWADYVFLTGMDIQKKSFIKIIKRCNHAGAKVVAGGPMVTSSHIEFLGIDHFILNEAELTLPQFLEDLKNGCPKQVYTSLEFPEITISPTPLWSLLDMKQYASMYLQYSRGCPFNCEFCSIPFLNGHKPRTKAKEQFIIELDALYGEGWRGDIFIVDDNFIGNKRKLKEETLPALIQWNKHHNYVYNFTTEVSINLVDDNELLHLMIQAGFDSVFIGIETPCSESLLECGKSQNLQRDLVASIKKLHQNGLRVSGGFIIGFDNDPLNIFEQQINFIKDSKIVTAMVGLLNAPLGTRLFKRLKSENRLLNSGSGDNMDGSINFIPKMNYQKLIKGYKEVLDTIYSQKVYYERVKLFLQEYKPTIKKPIKISFNDLKAFLKISWKLGIMEKGKLYYWKLFFLSIFKHPQKFSLSMTLAVYGFHFRRIVEMI